jgi:transcriptional regulator with XRE-family HTH domain
MTTEEKKVLQKKIGNNLKVLREKRNIEAKEVAALLKITVQQYGNIERGASTLDVIKLYEIANLLKAPVATLLNIEGSLTYSSTINTNENGNVMQGNNTVNHFVEKEYLAFLKNENSYLKQKLDGVLSKVFVK